MTRKHQLQHWIGVTLLVGSVMAWSAVAGAETIKARNTTSVYTSQGEKSRVVTRVPAGKTLTVLRTEGRWIKVRVNGLTGWITRSNATVSGAAARSTTTQNRKVSFVEGRSRKEKLETGPTDRVGSDAVKEDEQFDEDLSEADPAGDGKPGADDAEDQEPPRRVAAKEHKAKRKPPREAVEEEDFSDDSDDADDSADDDRERRPRQVPLDDEEDADADDAAGDDEGGDSSETETVVALADGVKLHAKPSRKSKSVDRASAGDELAVIERDGDWVKVETSDGEEGWVRAEDVGVAGAYQYKKWSMVANVGLAYRAIGQAFSSTSTDALGNYKISSGAAMLGVGGNLLHDYSEKYLIGGDALIGYTRASPGIRFTDPDTQEPVDIGFNVLQVDAGVRGGYKIAKTNGLAGFLRLGYHYERFSINNVSDFMEANTARLPSEILKGVTVGLSLDLPEFAKKYSARVGLDYLSTTTLGKRQQTTGLEDGELSKVSALWGNARFTYQWKEKMQILGTYQYAQATTKWDGVPEGSQRRHLADAAGTEAYSAARKDVTHTLMLGLTRLF